MSAKKRCFSRSEQISLALYRSHPRNAAAALGKLSERSDEILSKLQKHDEGGSAVKQVTEELLLIKAMSAELTRLCRETDNRIGQILNMDKVGGLKCVTKKKAKTA